MKPSKTSVRITTSVIYALWILGAIWVGFGFFGRPLAEIKQQYLNFPTILGIAFIAAAEIIKQLAAITRLLQQQRQ